MITREQFESVVTSPPYQESVERFPEHLAHTCAGHYRTYFVQFAWDVLQDILKKYSLSPVTDNTEKMPTSLVLPPMPEGADGYDIYTPTGTLLATVRFVKK